MEVVREWMNEYAVRKMNSQKIQGRKKLYVQESPLILWGKRNPALHFSSLIIIIIMKTEKQEENYFKIKSIKIFCNQ